MEDPILTCIGKYSGNAIYHMPNKHRYRYHCIVCGQGIASPKVMKLHYQQSHQGLLSQYGQKATALCQTYIAGGSPCQYCGARLAQPRAHKLVCPVLWQFCLSFAKHSHVPGPGRSGAGSEDERCVRQSGQGQCSSFCSGPYRPEPCSASNDCRSGTPTQSPQTGAWEARPALRQLTLWGTQPRSRSGEHGQGKGGKGGKTSPQVTALVKAMGRLVIRQETQLQILGMQIRREGLRRGGLANEVQRLLQAC